MLSEQTLRLGGVRLTHPVGEGGMGQVWGGVHEGTGAPVAVKVLTTANRLEPRWVQSFAAEVQAVAMMRHEGIIDVHDYGFIPDEVSARSRGQLVEGSPYLVMEFADAGCLEDILTPTFAQLKRLLLELLSALAHAHARQVIHLDLKPANVLLKRDGEGRARAKLSDFGISFDRRSVTGSFDMSNVTLVGTPAYMAPEQILSSWRDYGPWTDLYAVGCLTWEMCTGDVPFTEMNLLKLVNQHLNDPLPTFTPRMKVPVEFEAWLRKLLEKPAQLRFQSAAQAANALKALRSLEGDDQVERPLALRRDFEGVGERTSSELFVASAGAVTAHLPSQTAAPSSQSLLFGDTLMGEVPTSHNTLELLEPLSLPGMAKYPELPPSWRGAEVTRTASLGAGLGLWGLRAPPFVDREEARDVIWGALGEVFAGEGARVVVLRGEGGLGKSRLAEWMSRRAHELGAAIILRGSHSDHGGVFDGLEAMLRVHLGLLDLSYEEFTERMMAWHRLLGPIMREPEREFEVSEFVDLLWARKEDTSSAPARTSRVRWAVMARLIERISAHGPLVVWLEDVHLSTQTLAFLKHILEDSPAQMGALFLCTALPASAMADALLARATRDLSEHPKSIVRDVSVLAPRDQEALLGGMIRLDPEIVKQLVAQTGGNPNLAIQLISSWVERDVLIPGARGFFVDPDIMRTLSSDVSSLCEERLARLIEGVEGVGEESWDFLEYAALLVDELEREEWVAFCDDANVARKPRLLTAMIDAGLATARGDSSGWGFTTRACVEALCARIRGAGRWEAMHSSIADWLLARAGKNFDSRGRALSYLAETSRIEEATEQLVDLTTVMPADEVLRISERLQERIGRLGEEAPRALLFVIYTRARIPALLYSGRLAEVSALLLEAEQLLAALPSEPRHAYDSCVARLAFYEERFEDARATLEKYCQLDDTGQVVNIQGIPAAHFSGVMRLLGEVYQFSGMLDEAIVLIEAAAREFLANGDRYNYAWSRYAHAAALMDARRFEEGMQSLQQAMQLMHVLGDRMGLSSCSDLMGIYYHEQGDYSRACGHFRRAMNHARASGDAGEWISRENLARTLLLVERFEDALELADEIEAERARHGRDSIFLHPVRDITLTALAGLARWEAWERCWADSAPAFEVIEDMYDPGAEGFDLLIALLLERGESERARSVFHALEARMIALGEEEFLQSVRARFSRVTE